jgi:LPS-assembly lipoprotein
MRNLLVMSILASLLLGGCGYQLRRAFDLPKAMKSIYLQGGSAEFRTQFQAALKSSKGQLADSPEKADVVLVILRDNIERRGVSLSERGRSNQIELAQRIDYELRDSKNKDKVLVTNEPINIRREYFNDQQDVIAKDNEETTIRSEMYQQAIKTIISSGRNALENNAK